MPEVNNRYRSLFILVCAICGFAAAAAAESRGEPLPRFGGYEALFIDPTVVLGVKHGEDDKIWIMLDPAHKEKELRLKISMREGADYRKWYTGDEELVSAANQNKAPMEWTDWVRTQSPYIEYWIEGRKVLHLRRVG